MFKKLKQKLKELQQKQKDTYKVETEKFNDPIANQTDWYPAKKGGSNFKTHDLIKVSSTVYRYKLSMGAKLFLGLFALIGSIVTLVGASMIVSSEMSGFFFLLFGLIFTGVSYILYRIMGKPIIFDGSMGYIWIGIKPPKFTGNSNTNEKMIYFNDIHAMQIISERVRSDKSNFTSYELNLVLKDATRFNLIDHGNYSQIVADSEILSGFMGKPVWDVC